jgi:pyruvate/2-oxoacid:ferredoxin oxidoreductase alpha subunit
MRNLIDFGSTNEELYNKTVDYNDENGLKTYVLASREFNEGETSAFLENLQHCRKNLVDQEQNMEKLGLEMETY